MTEDSQTEVDLARVLAEIDEEVRLRRASGDLPPGLDRELDDLFLTMMPTESSDALTIALERAEETSFVDVDVPTASRIPGGSVAKVLLAKLLRWFVSHVAQQTTAFATAASRSLRLLGQRVEWSEARLHLLEEAPGAERNRIAAEPRPPAPAPDLAGWADQLAEILGGRPGRVAHVEAGAGSLVARLVELGVDAYGADPSEHHVAAAVRDLREVRFDDAQSHLARLPAGVLVGLVLSGCVERLPPAELLDMADQASRVLAPGGVIMVVSATPEGWGRQVAPMTADLAPGRPFHAETWAAVLSNRGFTAASVSWAPPSARLDRLPAGVDGAEVIDANFERLARAVCAPASYALTAVRSAAVP